MKGAVRTTKLQFQTLCIARYLPSHCLHLQRSLSSSLVELNVQDALACDRF